MIEEEDWQSDDESWNQQEEDEWMENTENEEW